MSNPPYALGYAAVVLDFLKALLWPAVVITVVLLFKAPLSDLVGRVREASGFGVSARLDPVVQQLADVTSALKEPDTGEPAVDTHETGRFASEIYPIGIGRVVYSWTNLESRCQDFVRANGLPASLSREVPGVFAWIVDNGLAPAGTAEVARDLRNVRNKIVHRPSTPQLSEAGVDDFVRSVSRLSGVLDDASAALARGSGGSEVRSGEDAE